MKLFVCHDHVELALDKVVDECECYPELNAVEKEEDLSTTCEYCEDKAVYIVANTHSSTK